MKTKWLRVLVPGLLIGAAGCPDVDVDPGEGVGDDLSPGPIAEFDPSNRIIPFPNNLLINPMTGRVNLPASCNESPTSMAIRVSTVNQLDGFGTYETVITTTFSEPLDATSLAGNVLLYKRATGTSAVDPTTAMPIPVVTVPGMTVRFSADCSTMSTVTQLVIVPMVPLEQKSSYVVALNAGIKTATGADYGPSFTWALIRQEEDPVTLDDQGNVVSDRTPLDPANAEDLAQLQGIDLLWKAHAQAMAFLRGTGKATEDVVLAWEFKTQTTTDPLDPAVTNSPAMMVATTPSLTGPIDGVPVPAPITGVAANRAAYPFQVCTTGAAAIDPAATPELDDVQCYLKVALGGGLTCTSAATCEPAFVAGSLSCASVGCANVGAVLAGRVRAKQYQTLRPNAAVPATMIPGPWSDPYAPMFVREELVTALIMVPAAAAPGTGRQIAIFQHGLGSRKETVLAIGPQLAGLGFATVAIDAVAHGSRAIQNSTDAAKGCSGTPTVTTAPQCFSPFLSADLGLTRDNMRQTVLDQLSLVAALKACGTTNCGTFTVDPAHIEYIALSLGALLGGMTVAVSPDLKASVLNVGGVGWLDIIENTQTAGIKCPLVDALIDAGVLMGDKSTAGATALCLTDAWKMQPGWRQLSAIARWVLDPADPANFTRKLATKRFLLQEVVGDQVVPNIAQERQGALTGLMGVAADCGAPNPSPPPAMLPSAALLSMPMTNKFLRYTTADATACPPAGNTFAHSSLLQPANTNADGRLATQRLQTDALFFLNANR